VTVNRLFKALLMSSVLGFHGKGKGKGSVHPRTGHEGPERE